MPEFRFSNGVLLARAVEVLLPLAKEGIINYSPEGLSLVVSEPSGLLKAALQIKSSGFTIFDCEVKSSASVNLEELYKELNRSTDEDALTIFGGDGDCIRFQYHSTSIEESFYAESEMILTQIYNKNLNINELQYKYEMGVSLFSEGFRNLITHLRQFGSRVFMTVKKSQVTFEVEGEETNLSTLIKQYRITSQIAEDDFLCSIFSLDHMRSLQNASLLSRFSNGCLLARAVEVFLPLAKEGIINYTPEELSLVVSEPSGVLKAALRIKSSGFTLFDCNINSSARVNLEELHKELNRSTGEDALTIYGGDGNYIRFQYHNTSTEDSLYSEMKLTQIYNEKMDINEFKNIYEAGVMIDSKGFRNLFRHLRQFGSTVLTTVKKSYVIFEVEGVETVVSTWNKHCYIMSSFAQGDFLCSIFNLDHMSSFQSASLLSNHVWILSSDKFNCKLYYPVAEGCFINFFFSPGCDTNL